MKTTVTLPCRRPVRMGEFNGGKPLRDVAAGCGYLATIERAVGLMRYALLNEEGTEVLFDETACDAVFFVLPNVSRDVQEDLVWSATPAAARALFESGVRAVEVERWHTELVPLGELTDTEMARAYGAAVWTAMARRGVASPAELGDVSKAFLSPARPRRYGFGLGS